MSGRSPPVITGNDIDFHPELTFSGYTKAKSRLLIASTVLAVIFFITTVIFIVLFVYNYIMLKTLALQMGAICNTPDCFFTAVKMVSKMNLSADPCMDFNEYACGRFIREVVIAEDRMSADAFSTLWDENMLIMKEIVSEEMKEDEPRYMSGMKRLFKSCMDQEAVERAGLQPYLNDPLASDWPTLNKNWNERNFNLPDVITRYMEVYTEPLVTFFINVDQKNSSHNKIYLSVPLLGLPQEYLSRPRDDVVIMAYEKFLTDTAVELGASMAVAEQDAKDVVSLMIALSKIMLPKEDTRDDNKLYNPITLEELSTLYPDLGISHALRTVFKAHNNDLYEEDIIINMFPTYLGNLSLVTKSFSNRTLQNLFGFHYAISIVGELTNRMKQISLEFQKVYTGIMSYPPQWEICLQELFMVFPLGMGKQFVTRTFPKTSKTYVEGMTDNLKNTFKMMIQENTWMGQVTKEEAFMKLATMKQMIGYPDSRFEEEDIESLYENYTKFNDDFYENRLLKNKIVNTEALLSLRKPGDTFSNNLFRKSRASRFPQYSPESIRYYVNLFEVNARYDSSGNQIEVPAGFLRPPFFSEKYLDYLNYGAVGAVIGHEITHGFDDHGSQYDGDGNLRSWWQDSEREVFYNRSQCIVDQNSEFHVDEIHMNLNGITTQDESVADHGGLKQSFRAYKALTLQRGPQPLLPGLGLTQDQLFFLSFSQMMCEKMTRESMALMVTTDEHPPGKYRIIGTLQNSEDFAKAYNCPRGSYMNPEEKCSVW